MASSVLDIPERGTATAWLFVGDEQLWSQIFRLSPDQVTRIGRGPDNEIVLTDVRCSRHHCDVYRADGRWVVRDCESRNGTFLGTTRIAESELLNDWDVIHVGPHTLVFTTNPDQLFPQKSVDSADTEDNIPVDALAGAPQPIVPRSRRSPALTPPPARGGNTSGPLPLFSASQALLGDSDAMMALREQIRRIAPTDATVLVRGESGVGKELVARSLHEHSARRTAPFFCLNCAALSESLLESELFGHEKGSFTGAGERKLGKFELAHTGTLFLDEVGELSPAIQAKFLRVLEGHPFHRIGGSAPITADVRLIAATNQDLEAAVKGGHFRSDLYFRLHVVQIHVPALRERRSDIPLLSRYFVQQAALQSHRPIEGLTQAALDRLAGYPWPGNVRELKNTIHRSVILCPGDVLDASDLHFSQLEEGSTAALLAADADTGQHSLKEVELKHILSVLERTQWNKSRAAEILGIERSTLDRKLKRNNVQRPGK
jgi:Nif-specific regulatory protein